MARFEMTAPADPGDGDGLDAYSRAVSTVAARLTPLVASLRVSRPVRGGAVEGGGSRRAA